MLRVTGMPWSRITALKTSLSMQSAEPSTPAPTYGTPASSSRPCTVPSSPNGPVQDREDDVDARRASPATCAAGSAAASRPAASRRCAGAELPAAVAVDLDRRPSS